MKVTLESTSKIVDINTSPARRRLPCADVLPMSAGQWGFFMKWLIVFALLAIPCRAQTISRRYWIVPVDTLAIGHPKHTHVETTGRVKYCTAQDDWDKHVRLFSLTDSTKFVMVEWVPTWNDSAKVWVKPTITCPPRGAIITVRGVTRWDPEHLWNEIHPAEQPWFKP